MAHNPALCYLAAKAPSKGDGGGDQRSHSKAAFCLSVAERTNSQLER